MVHNSARYGKNHVRTLRNPVHRQTDRQSRETNKQTNIRERWLHYLLAETIKGSAAFIKTITIFIALSCQLDIIKSASPAMGKASARPMATTSATSWNHPSNCSSNLQEFHLTAAWRTILAYHEHGILAKAALPFQILTVCKKVFKKLPAKVTILFKKPTVCYSS